MRQYRYFQRAEIRRRPFSIFRLSSLWEKIQHPSQSGKNSRGTPIWPYHCSRKCILLPTAITSFAGDNIIGRRSKGTNIHVPIESSDTTMERQHCIINISVNKQGKTIYTLRDFPSTSGTFLKHELLNKKERVILENGSIVTIGATTFIVYFSEEEQTYTD